MLEERVEQYTRKRVREIIKFDPVDAAALIAKVCIEHRHILNGSSGGKRDAGRTVHVSTKVAAVPTLKPEDVLSEEEMRGYYQLVSSSGRCRRDCPELYGHVMKRLTLLRHEEHDGEEADDGK